MTDQPTTMAVVLPGKYGQVNPERYPGEVVRSHFFVYFYERKSDGKTMCGLAHEKSGQPLATRGSRAGALWAISRFESLPVGWHRSRLSEAEWEAIREMQARMKAEHADRMKQGADNEQ